MGKYSKKRGGFATSTNRIIKAKKIMAVLTDYLKKDIKKLTILDIGCGSGKIAAFFAKNNEVFCVDIVDQLDKNVRKNVTFTKVKSELLPFPDDFFDIIISNHVIEHLKNQELHIKEIRRCLKNGGICYFATPNKNFLVEPHYRIPLLHYLPLSLFLSVLKILGIYQEDIHLLKNCFLSIGLNLKNIL
ncbi:class I SAM-dependent methyltransferase [Desulfonauticus submarinus]